MTFESIKSGLRGNIVPIPGQFNRDLSIDYGAYTTHIDFLKSNGVKNYYLALSASEFDYMTLNERVAVTKTTAKSMGDDCILIVQAVGGQWLQDQIHEAKLLYDNGADAIVIAPRSIKEGNKFFSSFYSRDSYDKQRHDSYYIGYMEALSEALQAPIVYHDKPFKNGKGPSLELLDRIMNIETVVSLKEHVPDPLTLKRIYGRYGDKVACFDGFGKTLQFWSLQWGAKGRHTCWSWFDPEGDRLFFDAIDRNDLTEAAFIVNNEFPVAEVICDTGFQGYKHIMKLMGLPAGSSRIPGEDLSIENKQRIKRSIQQIGLIA